MHNKLLKALFHQRLGVSGEGAYNQIYDLIYQLYLMNLSLILFVLSAFVAYLLYDMFKKSRQQQQIVQVQSQNQPQTNKLRPSYSSQCHILKSLHQQKMSSVKHKTISIHLLEESPNQIELSVEGKDKIKETLHLIRQTHRVHLLINRNTTITNPLLNYLRELKIAQIGFKSNEGAIAVLRQLNSNIHLQSEVALYKNLLQYLPNVWVADGGRTGQKFVNQYKSEWEMICALSQINSLYKKKEQ